MPEKEKQNVKIIKIEIKFFMEMIAQSTVLWYNFHGDTDEKSA